MNLKELSRFLGLSQTTVSRALNGFPEVSEQTRLRVAEAAQRHNYRPNARARGLATGRAMAIAHVIPVGSRHEIVNPVFADFIAGAGEAYQAADYEMLLSVVNEADEADAYRRMRLKGSADGAIVHGPKLNDPRIPLLTEIGLPFVVHGRSSEATLPYAWLDVNNRRAFERATEFLLDLGHQRIALINGLEGMDFAYRRRHGYENALALKGIAADPAIMTSTEMTETNGYRAAQRLLQQDNPPTAFLTSSMILAIGVRRAIQDAGLRLGKDVSIITHDDELSYMRNGDSEPIFTATRSSVREAGRLAAQMLLEMIADPPDVLLSRMLDCDLVVGQSTGPGPARGA